MSFCDVMASSSATTIGSAGSHDESNWIPFSQRNARAASEHVRKRRSSHGVSVEYLSATITRCVAMKMSGVPTTSPNVACGARMATG
jgi:hypothetical protein